MPDNKPLDAFWLKMLAIFGMTINHIGHIYEQQLPFPLAAFFYFGGGFTFPIMAFLMVEGYHKTSNLKRYFLRLLLFALITQPFFSWAFDTSMLNVLFTLSLGLLSLYLHDKISNRYLFFLAFVGIVVLSSFCDWPVIGVPLMYGFFIKKNTTIRVVLPLSVLFVAVGVPSFFAIFSNYQSIFFFLQMLGCLPMIPVLLSYNEKRGYNIKYFFYAYYPLHLGILALLKTFVFPA